MEGTGEEVNGGADAKNGGEVHSTKPGSCSVRLVGVWFVRFVFASNSQTNRSRVTDFFYHFVINARGLLYHPIRDDLSSELPARPTHAAPLRGPPSGTMPTSAVSNDRFRRL